MRVLHLQRAGGIGGSERHLLTLLPALCAAGIDVVLGVLVVDRGDAFAQSVAAQGVDVVQLHSPRDLTPALVPRLVSLIRSSHVDLVHTHLIHADLYGQLAAAAARTPAVSTVHGVPGPYGTPLGAAVERGAGRLARRTVCISRYVAEYLEGRGLVPRDRLRVVPYGLAPLSVPTPRVGPPKVFAIAGRLVPGKGHEFLLRAFARAVRERPDVRLKIIGDGPLRAKVEATVRLLGLEEEVQMRGFVADVLPELASADVVLFPTVAGVGEGFGLVVLEAMSLAKPVIATRLYATPEIVDDGRTGLLVRADDEQSFADAMLRLASDRDLCTRLGQEGLRRAREQFSASVMVQRTIEVYEESLGQ